MQTLINIDVDDLDRAVAFYERAVGLRPGRRFFGDTVAQMLGAGSPIYLVSKPNGSVALPQSSLTREYRRHWTPVHLDFVVKDIESAVHTALAAGATLEGEISAFNWGRLATMGDPFGHGFCLVQFVGRGYDEAASAAVDEG